MRLPLKAVFCLTAMAWSLGIVAAWATTMRSGGGPLFPVTMLGTVFPAWLTVVALAPALQGREVSQVDLALILTAENALLWAAVITTGVALIRRLRAAHQTTAPNVPAP